MPEVLQILFWYQNDKWMKDSDCSGTKVYFRLQLRVSKYLQYSWEERVKTRRISEKEGIVSLKVTLQVGMLQVSLL